MPLKKHHKIMIGSFSTLIITFMIVNTILVIGLFTRLELNYKDLESNLQETNGKINTLTDNIIQTKETLSETINSLESLDVEIGSIGKEFNTLKASAGDDFSGIIDNVIKGVVTIRTDVGQGTGFLITNDGYLVTNAHVLVGGRTIKTFTYNQESTTAEFVGYNRELDIALLKIKGTYEKLELDDSSNIQLGEKVIAIGNPLGLQFSVSQGIVSAIHRPGPNGIEAYIQTDAALNPGNSGGPLINKNGKVIGINNFKVGGSESLGFALESNHIKNSVNEIAQENFNQTLI